MIIPSIWAEQPGTHFCVSTKTEHGRWRDDWFSRNELTDAEAYARDQRELCDVYFCPNGFAISRRRAQGVVRGVFLFADLDGADPREIEWEPTIAIESSPGRYVGLWRVDQPITDTLNKRMTYAVGADRGGWDCTQVLRYPGTYNWKYSTCPRVKLLWDDGPRYRVRDLERELRPVDPVISVIPLDVKPASHEWREVCRRLGVLEAYVKRDPDHDRSRVTFRLAARLIKRNATPDELACVLLACPHYLSKWGTDMHALAAEVSRLWAKLKA
jgi:RepB DNA-primase N-terminal domain